MQWHMPKCLVWGHEGIWIWWACDNGLLLIMNNLIPLSKTKIHYLLQKDTLYKIKHDFP